MFAAESFQYTAPILNTMLKLAQSPNYKQNTTNKIDAYDLKI